MRVGAGCIAITDSPDIVSENVEELSSVTPNHLEVTHKVWKMMLVREPSIRSESFGHKMGIRGPMALPDAVLSSHLHGSLPQAQLGATGVIYDH